jgi:hypothetical protein
MFYSPKKRAFLYSTYPMTTQKSSETWQKKPDNHHMAELTRTQKPAI